MTTITIELPDGEINIISKIIDIVKDVSGCRVDIHRFDDGLTNAELTSIKRSLKQAGMIKRGELKPLSMNDLWN